MSEYWDAVKAIARSVREEYRDPHGSKHERLESIQGHVDGSAWIVNYDLNEEVLEETRNYPDERSVASYDNNSGDWKKVRQITAYLAMVDDVLAKIEEMDEESEEFEPIRRKRWPRRLP